jgi:ABC-2 type transport system permease protein
MAVDIGRRSEPRAPSHGVPLRSRIYGLGSVYAKTLRDSRRAFLIVAILFGGLMFLLTAALAKEFPTEASRRSLVELATGVNATSPILAGIVGNPVNVGTIGGYVNWKYGPVFLFVAAIWSILALSGTLAAEARRGSLDMVASGPIGRRRLALEKAAAHVTVMGIAMAVFALGAWLGAAAFARLPGDAISIQAAIGYALMVGLTGLAAGSVAFALSPVLGRAAAGGVAAVVLVAAWLVNGYQGVFPALSGIAHLSWYSWTANQIPIAGRYDWLSLLPVAAVIIVLLAIGTELFARRDLGATASIAGPRLPAPLLGLRGPTGRSLAERLPTALWWGFGLGLFGFVIAASTRSLAASFAKLPASTDEVFKRVLPNYDILTAGGFLQLVFVELGFVVVGFAAAMLVAGWASDETSGRLETLLATPLARVRWALTSGAGVLLAILGMTIVLAIGIGLGALSAGSDAGTPVLATVTLGLYAAALAGLGFAVGGLVRASIAAEVVAAVVVLTFLLDLLAPGLNAPTWVHDLALTAHLGQPMVGRWDAGGIIACVVIAGVGLALGAWGIRRRDVAR